MTYVGAAAERALIAIDFEQQVHYDISGLSQRSAVSPKENWNRHPARRGWVWLELGDCDQPRERSYRTRTEEVEEFMSCFLPTILPEEGQSV